MTNTQVFAVILSAFAGVIGALIGVLANRKLNVSTADKQNAEATAELSRATIEVVTKMEEQLKRSKEDSDDQFKRLKQNHDDELKRHQNQISDLTSDLTKIRSDKNEIMIKYADVVSQQRDMTRIMDQMKKENQELKTECERLRDRIKICEVNHGPTNSRA